MSVVAEAERAERARALAARRRAERRSFRYIARRIPFYLLDLAREFHGFYQNHRFLGETPERTESRLALARAVRTVVANGLSLIGVSAPERM